MIFSEKFPDRAICQRPDGMWTLHEVYDGYGVPHGTVFHESVARGYLNGVEPSLEDFEEALTQMGINADALSEKLAKRHVGGRLRSRTPGRSLRLCGGDGCHGSSGVIEKRGLHYDPINGHSVIIEGRQPLCGCPMVPFFPEQIQ